LAKQDAFVASRRDKQTSEATLKEINELQEVCLDLSNEKLQLHKQTEQIVRPREADPKVSRTSAL
jgi:hypothetical protein